MHWQELQGVQAALNPFFRDATIEDLSSLSGFEQVIIESGCPFDSKIENGNTTYYDLEGLSSKSDSMVFVADSGCKVVGSGYAQIRESKQCFVTEHDCYFGFTKLSVKVELSR